MKNISLYLNIVLVIAVAVLFYLHFSSSPQSESAKPDGKKGESLSLDDKIAYVNIDTLFENYTFYQDLRDLLLKKQQSSEADLNSRSQSLQRRAMDFQEKYEKRLITTRQAEEMQQKLMRDQQNLMQLREQITQELMQDEQELNKQLYDSISSFLKDYNTEHGYKLVLSASLGANVLYAEETLDITQDVVKGLNQRYNGEATEEQDTEKKQDKDAEAKTEDESTSENQ